MKKGLLLGVLILMIVSLTSCKSEYIHKEENLEFTITVDKTEVNVGDEIEVVAKLENKSGQDIYTQMVHTDYKSLEDMILIGIFNENSEYVFVSNLKGGPVSNLVFKKDSFVEKKVTLIVDENVTDVVAFMSFNYGENYEDNIYLYSNVIKLKIQEN